MCVQGVSSHLHHSWNLHETHPMLFEWNTKFVFLEGFCGSNLNICPFLHLSSPPPHSSPGNLRECVGGCFGFFLFSALEFLSFSPPMIQICSGHSLLYPCKSHKPYAKDFESMEVGFDDSVHPKVECMKNSQEQRPSVSGAVKSLLYCCCWVPTWLSISEQFSCQGSVLTFTTAMWDCFCTWTSNTADLLIESY